LNKRYQNEIARWVAQGLGWAVEESVKADKKLSQDEILQLVRKDCARGGDGRPVLYSAPSPISKRIKLSKISVHIEMHLFVCRVT
jgi:hypothetical protein